jgi:hypothetical protein
MSTPALILEEISAENFSLTKHARIRMNERNISTEDIIECANTGVISQAGNKFEIVGYDMDGEKMSIICVYEDGVLIITVI